MKKTLILLFLPFAATAQQAKDFELKGTLKSARPVDLVYLTYRTDGNTVNDSLQLKDGAFLFNGKLAEPTMATLRVKYALQNGEQKPKTEAVPVFLQSGKISFVATDSLKNNEVKGSAAHKDYLALTELQKPFEKVLNPLYDEWSRFSKEKKKDSMQWLEAKIDSVDGVVKEKVYKIFVLKYPKSPVALYAVKQFAGYGMDGDKVAPVFASLPAATQQWPTAVEFKEQITIAQKTGIGKMALDFTQNDTLGNPVSLSSFRGKYVLVDFWASWCGPCRRENPNVVKVFNQYKDNGFTVLGVSLDRPNAKEKWLKAINDDGLTWTQVSDLQFWNNAVAKQYGINAIPQNLLIDPSGKIIAKNLRGEELQAKLAELFEGKKTM